MRLIRAYLKKKLGIVSPSIFFGSDGKFRYEYDWLKYQRRFRNGRNA